MIRLTYNDNLALFHRAFEQYWRLTRKSRADALSHTAKNFSFFFVKRLSAKAMPKGGITKERLAAMKGGKEGIKISHRARDLVYAKYGVRLRQAKGWGAMSSYQKTWKGANVLFAGADDKKRGLTKKQQNILGRIGSAGGGNTFTLQALLAQQELKLREGHRLFSAMSARFKGDLKGVTMSTKNGKPLGRGRSVGESEEASGFVFDWGNAVGKWSTVAAVGLTSPSRVRLHEEALNDTRLDMLTYVARKQDEAARNAARTVRRT
jgi:hypothetical protein